MFLITIINLKNIGNLSKKYPTKWNNKNEIIN